MSRTDVTAIDPIPVVSQVLDCTCYLFAGGIF